MNKSYPIAIISFWLAFSFTCLSIQSCVSDDENYDGQNRESPQDLPEKLPKDITQKGDSMAILVLCDLSTSLNSESIDLMAERAEKLVRIMPPGSRISFYPTERETMESEVFSFHKNRARRTSEKNRIKKENHEGALAASQAILESYDAARKAYKKTDLRSCIWSNIEAKISWFDSYSRNYCRYLFIMSDMIEQCEETPVGNVSFKKSQQKNIESKIDNYSKSVFSEYDDLNVRVFVPKVTNTRGQSGFLSDNKVKEIWVNIFEKMGYTRKLAYGPVFPENLINECREAAQK